LCKPRRKTKKRRMNNKDVGRRTRLTEYRVVHVRGVVRV
jgi:hypothetical protein